MCDSHEPKVSLRGYIDVPADRRAAVEQGLPQHIALTRAEPGCVSFEVTPDPDVAGRFQVAELFENRAAFDAHQERASTSPWAQITKGIPRNYEITEIAHEPGPARAKNEA